MKAVKIVLSLLGTNCVAAGFISIFVCFGAMAEGQQPANGRVYAMTNSATGNTVVAFERSADGLLTQIQEVATGGLGSGPGVLPPPLPPNAGPDPLQSQDALRLSDDGRFLLAANAGSNEISVLAVTPLGLALVDKVASGGTFPVSVATYNSLVYVLNEGENAATFAGGVASISGFLLDSSGHLSPISGSTRMIGSDVGAADVLFSPEGDELIVTERFTNQIDVFAIGTDGLPGTQLVIPSNGIGPFGASFGQEHVLAVTESDLLKVNGRVTGVANGSSMSTYRLLEDGELETISNAASLNVTASCWVRFTPDHRFAYTTDSGSGTISIISISPGGAMTPQASTVAGGPFSGVVDLDITPDGQFLYVLEPLGGAANTLPLGNFPPGTGRVQGFRIEPDGSLTPITTAGALPFTSQGLVVR